jgi:hypothetical protein
MGQGPSYENRFSPLRLGVSARNDFFFRIFRGSYFVPRDPSSVLYLLHVCQRYSFGMRMGISIDHGDVVVGDEKDHGVAGSPIPSHLHHGFRVIA